MPVCFVLSRNRARRLVAAVLVLNLAACAAPASANGSAIGIDRSAFAVARPSRPPRVDCADRRPGLRDAGDCRLLRRRPEHGRGSVRRTRRRRSWMDACSSPAATRATARTPPRSWSMPMAPASRRRARMTAARYFHTATLLDDGRVLVVGGTPGAAEGHCSRGASSIRRPGRSPVAGELVGAAGCCTRRRSLQDGRVLIVGGIDDGNADRGRRDLGSGRRASSRPPARSPIRERGRRRPCWPTAASWWREGYPRPRSGIPKTQRLRAGRHAARAALVGNGDAPARRPCPRDRRPRRSWASAPATGRPSPRRRCGILRRRRSRTAGTLLGAARPARGDAARRGRVLVMGGVPRAGGASRCPRFDRSWNPNTADVRRRCRRCKHGRSVLTRRPAPGRPDRRRRGRRRARSWAAHDRALDGVAVARTRSRRHGQLSC